MANEKEEIILEVKIDQGSALKDLEKIEKAILNNKEAQKELNDAYKKGTVTQDEYIEENIRLQQNLKKEQEQRRTLGKLIDTESNSRNALKAKVSQLVKEYDNLNLKTAEGIKRQKELEKELSTLNTQISKTSKSAGLFKDQIGNYSAQFGEAAKSINVAGVSVGEIGAKLASFANPATAAIGIVTALGAAYARSTIGAKDLDFAQNQLAFATTQVTNRLADLISSSKDGEGAITRLFNTTLKFVDKFPAFLVPRFLLKQVGIDIGEIQKKSKELALDQERLEDLSREELVVRDKINERLERNSELLTEINDSNTSINDKAFDLNEMENNIHLNASQLLEVKKQELDILNKQLGSDIENEALQTTVLQKQLEISNIEKDEAKRVKQILVLKDNINTAEEKRLKLLGEEARINRSIDKRIAGSEIDSTGGEIKSRETESKIKADLLQNEATEEFVIKDRLLNDITKINKNFNKEQVEDHQKALQIKHDADLAYLDLYSGILGATSTLFKHQGTEYKVFASLQTLISTYSAAQKAFESQASIPFVGPELGGLAAAEAIIEGLARVANINGIQFFDGGYTGHGGKYEKAGIVHKGEVVWNQQDVAIAGGPTAVDRMRPTFKGYADGGIVTSSLTRETNNAVIEANAIKNLPAPIVGVKELAVVMNQVKVKENISSL